MLDITAVPTRVLTCPFPVVSFNVAMPQDAWPLPSPLLLLVGRDRACAVSLQEHNVFLRKFVPQYHRTLVAGACCMMGRGDGAVLALADAASTVTLHRVHGMAHDLVPNDSSSGTVFIGDTWDATPRIDCITAVCSGGCGDVDAVCTRKGESDTAWAISFEREEAQRLKLDSSLKRLFPQYCSSLERQHQQTVSGCFVGATQHGVSLFSSTTGSTLLHFKLPIGMGHAEAVQASGYGIPWYVVATSCGAALVYDQRRADQPVWSKQLCALSSLNSCSNTPVLMTSGSGGVWAIRAAEQLHLLRCTEGSIVCRSFASQRCLLPPELSAAGLFLTSDVLHIVGGREDQKEEP
ncbi:hypothetical protein DQ04_00671100 [Trypanosoma grayi]|uniref:hypothetical protein n=1 Tax=Trypanosoma grayi TaxID=71804 RepID=UPI0004F4152A|nr:hypothetical protein DQ04_00671100 [Trypanosoma grayi]KEG14007.1 hypothetical protein DQ04_00671100 [Trypanosoma grayi]